MLSTIRTLLAGSLAETEERLIDTNAIRLLEQKIREAAAAQRHAKQTLAGVLARLRAEERAIDEVERFKRDLEERALAALDGGRDDLAAEAAKAIAERENELALRVGSSRRIECEATRLRALVERGERRLTDLRQGLVVARHTEAARSARARMGRTLNSGANALKDAEAMLERVLSSSETEDAAAALEAIESELSHEGIRDRLEREGFGHATQSTPDSVLNRLKTGQPAGSPASIRSRDDPPVRPV